MSIPLLIILLMVGSPWSRHSYHVACSSNISRKDTCSNSMQRPAPYDVPHPEELYPYGYHLTLYEKNAEIWSCEDKSKGNLTHILHSTSNPALPNATFDCYPFDHTEQGTPNYYKFYPTRLLEYDSGCAVVAGALYFDAYGPQGGNNAPPIDDLCLLQASVDPNGVTTLDFKCIQYMIPFNGTDSGPPPWGVNVSENIIGVRQKCGDLCYQDGVTLSECGYYEFCKVEGDACNPDPAYLMVDFMPTLNYSFFLAPNHYQNIYYYRIPCTDDYGAVI